METEPIRKYKKIKEDEDSMTYEITIDKIDSLSNYSLIRRREVNG